MTKKKDAPRAKPRAAPTPRPRPQLPPKRCACGAWLYRGVTCPRCETDLFVLLADCVRNGSVQISAAERAQLTAWGFLAKAVA